MKILETIQRLRNQDHKEKIKNRIKSKPFTKTDQILMLKENAWQITLTKQGTMKEDLTAD